MRTRFQPGDKVLRYRDHHDTRPRIKTVKRVTARTVVLTDGEQFTADGREWGHSNEWFHVRIERIDPPTTRGDAVERTRG